MIWEIVIWIPVVVVLVWFIVFIAVTILQWQEERVHSDWEKRANAIKKQAIAMPFIEGQLKKLESEMQPKLQKIYRQKQFIQDIMPFIHK